MIVQPEPVFAYTMTELAEMAGRFAAVGWEVRILAEKEAAERRAPASPPALIAAGMPTEGLTSKQLNRLAWLNTQDVCRRAAARRKEPVKRR